MRAARLLVRFYQLALSPYLGGQCRFHPTCSQYALDALAAYGLWRGLGKALWRVAKCHPWHPGGYDPA
ncbi:MAG: membrane protein insertion efficiency factor YidD [Pseudomonadota bacterium]